VLGGITLEVAAGESLAIVGPSGSGKSTLLHIIGTLDRPTSGQVWLAGKDVSQLHEREVAAVRNRQIGFVFSGAIISCRNARFWRMCSCRRSPNRPAAQLLPLILPCPLNLPKAAPPVCSSGSASGNAYPIDLASFPAANASALPSCAR